MGNGPRRTKRACGPRSKSDAILIQPLPYPQAEALVGVWPTAPGVPGVPSTIGCTPSMYFTYRDENTTFEHFGVWRSGDVSVVAPGDPWRAGRRGREARLGPIFGVTALDPVTYAAVPALLIAASVLASYLPARRAVTLDPVQALRAE